MSAPARLMTKAEAAEYCGVSPEGYQAWQKRGLVPGPIAGTRRYDIRAIDAALDKMSGLNNHQQRKSAAEEWLDAHGY